MQANHINMRRKWAPVAGARARLSLTFAALALVLFGTVGVTAGRHAGQRVEDDAGEALLQVAARMAFALDADVYERFREIQNLAQLEPLLRDQTQPAQWRGVVEQLQRTSTHYAWIGRADADGTVLASTGGLLEGASVAKRGWFQEAQKGPFVGGAHEALLLASKLPPRPDGEPLRLIDVAAPLVVNGRVLGVLGGHLDLAWAEARRAAVLQGLTSNRGVELLVFDSDGKPVLAADKKAGARLTQALDAVRAGRPGVQTWGDGRQYLTAAVSVDPGTRYPSLHWTVVARQPVHIALAAARNMQQQIWLFGLLGAALFGLTGWWLAGRLTAPLRRVAAQALAALPDDGAHHADEVTQLSHALGNLVTRLRAREQELLALNHTLEDKVAARTAALESTNADLRAFTHSVSHDLKAPVGSIAAALRMVLRRAGDNIDPTNAKTLRLLIVECERLVTLTEEFLTLAMLERHKLNSVPIAMNALVRTVVDDVRTQVLAGVSTGSPLTQVDIGDLPDMVGDPTLVRQVWINLIANAFKFSSKHDAPRVRIRAEMSAEPGNAEAVYVVQDNGVGFDAQSSNKLFGLFERLHSKDNFPGTGVGLSIVKRIVHRHGGRIWAQSATGQGATFSFTAGQRSRETQ